MTCHSEYRKERKRKKALNYSFFAAYYHHGFWKTLFTNKQANNSRPSRELSQPYSRKHYEFSRFVIGE